MLMDNILELLGITDSNIKITRFSAEFVNGEKRNVIEAREGITATGIARICHCSPSSVIRIIDEDNQGALHEPLHEPGKSCGEIRSCRPECPVHQVHQGIFFRMPGSSSTASTSYSWSEERWAMQG